ncbi:MAG: cytochrome-c oxidase, cbb3-type subunit II [Gammaproteobacteria bacterium]
MLARLHKLAESHALAFITGILLTVSAGGLAQILPLIFSPPGEDRPILQIPYSAAALAGRAVYIRESCGLCHSQQVRPLLAETRRYGEPSLPEEFVYDRPFLWGSKRTGPDLARLGGKYSDAWHRLHLRNPQAVVASSIMPAYPWLESQRVDPGAVQAEMMQLARFGVPYSKEEIAGAARAVDGMSDTDALVAYLQSLGLRAETP